MLVWISYWKLWTNRFNSYFWVPLFLLVKDWWRIEFFVKKNDHYLVVKVKLKLKIVTLEIETFSYLLIFLHSICYEFNDMYKIIFFETHFWLIDSMFFLNDFWWHFLKVFGISDFLFWFGRALCRTVPSNKVFNMLKTRGHHKNIV